MYYQPTPEQIESYREQGFLVVENFLSPDELEHWREVTMDAVAQRLSTASGNLWPLSNQNSPDEFYAQVFTQCLRLADTHDGMRELMCDARLGELVGTLAEVDGIRIWHDQALFKPPFGNATSWHIDNPYWSFFSKNAVSIWVALDDATLENGCLYYLPGTHKTARYDNVGIGQNQRDLFKHYPEWTQIPSVAAPAKAGWAVVHNGLTAHGAGANMTNGPRRAMACAYMPDGSTFNGQKNIMPPKLRDSYQVGDVLNSDWNPLIWSKNAIAAV